MKKYLLVLITLFAFLNHAFALNYSFYSYPMDNRTVDLRTKDWYDFLIYQWNTTIWKDRKKIDTAYIGKVLKEVEFFKFFKIAYYYENSLWKINDWKINLSYIDKKKLIYPIVMVYTTDKILYVIHKDFLSANDQKIVWKNYQSSQFKISKNSNFYIVSLKYTEQYKNNTNKDNYSYKYTKYFNIFKDLYAINDIVTFQVGQNPFEKNNIDGFGNNFMQFDYLYSNKIIWSIVSLNKEFNLKTISSQLIYSDDYEKDKYIYENVNAMFNKIKSYYSYYGDLPTDLWSLAPRFEDITNINKYNHSLYYEKIDFTCYNLWFKPKSKEFKKIFSDSINKQWYWYNKRCVN